MHSSLNYLTPRDYYRGDQDELLRIREEKIRMGRISMRETNRRDRNLALPYAKYKRQNKTQESVPSHWTRSAVGNGHHMHTHAAGDDLSDGNKGLFHERMAGIQLFHILLVR